MPLLAACSRARWHFISSMVNFILFKIEKIPPPTPETGRHHAQRIRADECENLVVIFASAMMQNQADSAQITILKTSPPVPINLNGR